MSGPSLPADLRLSVEEVAELTERLIETRNRGPAESGVPLGTCRELFAAHVSAVALESAVLELLERRERRLSSVLRRKADELERMLLLLLVRLDAEFHTSVRIAAPETVARGEWVVLDLGAAPGELEVRVRRVCGDRAERLFTLLVQSRAPVASWLGRWMKPGRAQRVVVLEPAGLKLEDLLAWTLDRGPDRRGRLLGLAFERLGDTVLGEVERAMDAVRDLRFGGASAPQRSEP